MVEESQNEEINIMKIQLTIILFCIFGYISHLNAQGIKIDTITLVNKNAELHAVVTIPEGEGPFPGLVYIHGSGPEKKNIDYARYFAQRGIAFVTYDKRSIGKSTGKFYSGKRVRYKNLELMASDACLGAQYLKNMPQIDTQKIGLIAFSQGGWIAPIAASIDNDISFLVIISGGAITVGEQRKFCKLTYEYKGNDFFTTFSKEEIKTIESDLKKAEYDPIPILKSLDIKVFWLYGENDAIMPISTSLNNINILKDQYKKEYTIKVFENRNHILRLHGDSRLDAPEFIRQLIVDWINEI
jgi:uncharacterized protein